jgi:hypothetical protein
VHDNANWRAPAFESPNLRSKSPADKQTRDDVRKKILNAEQLLKGHTSSLGPPFEIRDAQKKNLDAWVDGNFDDAPASPAAAPTADGLTRAALEGAVGQGFCPGIEAGIIALDPTIYASPFDFRIDHAQLSAGDLTALMAQPWQADFLKCNTKWWPSQRPDVAFQDPESSEDWIRGVNNHKQLVERYQRLGFIVKDGANEVFLEAERDPALPG